MDYGLVTLLPTLLVLGLAIWSRRTLESVLAGALFAFFIMRVRLSRCHGGGHADHTDDRGRGVGHAGLRSYGGFIGLLVKGGGSYALAGR
ncbi:MAG: hypothetical protein CM15mP103_06010 [Gammaproteobacteria bacterium]|nr:MAG: hypothetical protein CM15mP103_06010 [Gammaproteobacteria bacterium]